MWSFERNDLGALAVATDHAAGARGTEELMVDRP